MRILLCTSCVEFSHFFFDILAIVYSRCISSGTSYCKHVLGLDMYAFMHVCIGSYLFYLYMTLYVCNFYSYVNYCV
jgi:hypothetical protein